MPGPLGPLTISIVVPARNEADNITACLDAVFSQETDHQPEVLVIDSGSSDGTVELVKQYPGVMLKEIPAQDFGHGKTRNLGAELTGGEYIVFLNADALPADKHWLARLTGALKEDSNTAGVFSRHLPKKDCHLYMVRDLLSSMPDRPMARSRAGALDFMLFSTVSCAIRRDVWQKHRFKQDILIAEDQEWARRVLEDGYNIRYEPASLVLHSHNYSPAQLYDIKRIVSLSTPKFKRIFSARLLGIVLVSAGIKLKWLGDILFILFNAPGKRSLASKLKEIKIALTARIASFRGRYAGWLEAASEKRRRG
jgi:rhamnosyltransferase